MGLRVAEADENLLHSVRAGEFLTSPGQRDGGSAARCSQDFDLEPPEVLANARAQSFREGFFGGETRGVKCGPGTRIAVQ